MYLNLPFALTAPKDHTHSQDCSVIFKIEYHIVLTYIKVQYNITLQYVFGGEKKHTSKSIIMNA